MYSNYKTYLYLKGLFMKIGGFYDIIYLLIHVTVNIGDNKIVK